MGTSEESTWSWRRAAMLGAILIQPVLGLAAYVYGAAFGSEPFVPDGAPKVSGAEGGANAVGIVIAIYLLTLGIAPLVVSFAGAVLGVVISYLWHGSKKQL